MGKKPYALAPELIQNYLLYQEEQERSAATIQKYAHDLIGNLNEGLSVFLD